MPRAESSSPRLLGLPETLDLPAAAPLAESLLKCVGEDLVLDASEVRRLGGSCLQVLLSAARTWSAEGDALTLDRPSPQFVEDLRLFGLTAENLATGVESP